MNDAPPIPRIFDRAARAAHLARAVRGGLDSAFLGELMAMELAERLALVSRRFEHVLFLGPVAAFARTILPADFTGRISTAAPVPLGGQSAGHWLCDEDRLAMAASESGDADGIDLVIAGGGLDSVDDLPGALIQIRRLLRPDGLFIASLFGAGSLSALKRAMLAADADRASARIHPLIDVRAAGDLLQRAGFTMPVADGHEVTVRYSSLAALVGDLRAFGQSNSLVLRRPMGGKGALARALAEWADMADADGKVAERLAFIEMSGWSPAPDQPKPARRGSATTSLAQALRDKSGPGLPE